MVGIGLRVYSNSAVYFSIIEESSGVLTYKTTSYVTVPNCLIKPESLSFVRNTLLDIFKEYKVNRAGIRVSEFNGFHPNQKTIERFYLEGIIQESVASSTIEKYIAGQISSLSSILQFKREEFKKYTKGNEKFPNYPLDWSKLSLEEKESVIVAVCSLKI